MRGRPPAAHGTVGRYKSKAYQCRCVPCKEAMADHLKEQKVRRAEIAANPDDHRHGTRSFYTNYGCRCEQCIQANRNYFKGGKA